LSTATALSATDSTNTTMPDTVAIRCSSVHDKDALVSVLVDRRSVMIPMPSSGCVHVLSSIRGRCSLTAEAQDTGAKTGNLLVPVNRSIASIEGLSLLHLCYAARVVPAPRFPPRHYSTMAEVHAATRTTWYREQTQKMAAALLIRFVFLPRVPQV
jgi:hypothetical protein